VNIGWIYRPIEHLLALRLDVLSAVSLSESEQLRSLNLVSPRRIHVVNPTIRSDIFAPADRFAARRALGLGQGPVVIAIGRLTAQKDPLVFAEFVAALRKRVGDLRAVWVGDGELRAAMEDRIADLRLTDVLTVAGWVDDVRDHVAACDLLVNTSAYESFGYVTAEALAMDRPVVASKIMGTVDIVRTDVADQLYPYRDVTTAAELAERLLCDRNRASEVAHRGREYVLSTFSTEAMRQGLDGAYAAAARRS
jgi:glycosyltransferase involved in cell wall biosynthesis